MAYTLSPKSSDFIGYPFETYTYTRNLEFRKSNCGPNQVGSLVNYSKNYISNVSYEDAENMSILDNSVFMSQGQANANTQGTCTTNCVDINSNAQPTVLLSMTNALLSKEVVGISSGRIYQYNVNTTGGFSVKGRAWQNEINKFWSYEPVGHRSNTIKSQFPISDPAYSGRKVYSAIPYKEGEDTKFLIRSQSYSNGPCSTNQLEFDNLPLLWGGLVGFRVIDYGYNHPLNGVFYAGWTTSGSSRIITFYHKNTSGVLKTLGTHSMDVSLLFYDKFSINIGSSGSVFFSYFMERRGTGLQNSYYRLIVYKLTKDSNGNPLGVQQMHNEYIDRYIDYAGSICIQDTLAVFFTTATGYPIQTNAHPKILTIGDAYIPPIPKIAPLGVHMIVEEVVGDVDTIIATGWLELNPNRRLFARIDLWNLQWTISEL